MIESSEPTWKDGAGSDEICRLSLARVTPWREWVCYGYWKSPPRPSWLCC